MRNFTSAKPLNRLSSSRSQSSSSLAKEAAVPRPRTSSFDRYADQGVDDYSDDFAKNGPASGSDSQKLRLASKLSSRSWVSTHATWVLFRTHGKLQLGEDEKDEEDPFAEVEDALDGGFDTDTLEANVHRDKVAKMCSFVNDLLDGMNAEADELAIRDGCIYLVCPDHVSLRV